MSHTLQPFFFWIGSVWIGIRSMVNICVCVCNIMLVAHNAMHCNDSILHITTITIE